MPASWQLPPGVPRGLWDYLHDPAIARGYDAQLADTPLLRHDQEFVFRHVPEPGRFIDLGCGTGRLSISLAQRGHRVVAVDLSQEMLRVAGEKAATANVHIERVQANLVELNCFADKTFDAAGCLFSTLGMIAGAEHRRRMLTHVRRLLRPGGIFVLHVHNRWFHLGTRAGRRLLRRNVWQALTGRGTLGDFEMPPHQGVGIFTMHLFSRREVVRLLHQTGFRVVEVQPVGVQGPLQTPRLFGGLRAYGYFIAARAPVG
jgi:ubiquinone/menaquinone biosynthesis C-methylase UbiE